MTRLACLRQCCHAAITSCISQPQCCILRHFPAEYLLPVSEISQCTECTRSAAAKRGEAARPARQAATGNVRVPERAAEAAPTPAVADLMRAPVLPRQDGEGGGGIQLVS